MKNVLADTIFVEKYRPKSLDELILPERIKKKLANGVYQHLLFYSSPGTGKTSTAKAVCEQFNYAYDYINASNETSVDVIRERIEKWCSTFSLIDSQDGIKVVILDELDGVSDQFNKALKATMERFQGTSRFIATTNYINKIPDNVQSRFELINFDFTDDEEKEVFRGYVKRVYEICKAEGMEIEKDALVELVKRKFPDMRSILNVLQGYKNDGITKITLEDVKKFHGVYKDVFELIFNNVAPDKNYQHLVSEYSHRVDDVLATLGNDFIEFIQLEKPTHIKFIPQIIIEVAKHQAQRVHVIDNVVTLLSCVFSIQSIINNAK